MTKRGLLVNPPMDLFAFDNHSSATKVSSGGKNLVLVYHKWASSSANFRVEKFKILGGKEATELFKLSKETLLEAF